MTVSLRALSRENVRAVCELRLADGQRHLVAPAAYTVAEGHYEPGALLRAIYLDETVHGERVFVRGCSSTEPSVDAEARASTPMRSLGAYAAADDEPSDCGSSPCPSGRVNRPGSCCPAAC